MPQFLISPAYNSCLPLILSAVSLVTPALSESPIPTLPKVIVKAKIPSERNQYPRIKSLMDKSLITNKTITKQQYQTVTQAMKSLPGLIVVQSGNEGQQTSLFIRGTNSNHTQIRRDGVKLLGTDIYSGAFNFGALKTSDIDSIEVIRGPVTSLYGADAPGGVVLLTTPVGADSPTERLSLEGGSRKSYKAKGELQGEIQQTNIYANITRYGTGGFYQTPQKYRIDGGKYRKIPNHQTLGTLRLGQKISDATNVSFINSFTRNDLKTQKRDTVATMSTESSFHRLLMNHTTDAMDSTWGAGFTQNQSHEDKSLPTYLRTHLSRFQLDAKGTWTLLRDHALTLSGEWGQDYIKTSYPTQTPKTHFKDHEIQIGGGFLYRWTNDPVVLETSARLDHLEKNKTYPTYRLSGRYEFISETWITLGYGTGIKEPTLTQRYFKGPDSNPNPNLKAEEIQSYEAALSRYWTQDLKMEIIYFHNKLKSMIDYDFQSKKNINIGRAITKGIEAIIKYQIREYLLLEGNYTYTHAKNTTRREWLKRRPFNKWSGQLTYERDDLITCLEFTYVGKRPDVHPLTYKTQTVKGYSQLDLKIEKFYTPQMKIYGRIENCLNDHRENPMGFHRARLGIFAGLEVKFG